MGAWELALWSTNKCQISETWVNPGCQLCRGCGGHGNDSGLRGKSRSVRLSKCAASVLDSGPGSGEDLQREAKPGPPFPRGGAHRPARACPSRLHLPGCPQGNPRQGAGTRHTSRRIRTKPEPSPSRHRPGFPRPPGGSGGSNRKRPLGRRLGPNT